MASLKIPTYERKYREPEATPVQQPHENAPPAAAFGQQQAQNIAQTGKAIGDIGDRLAEHAIAQNRQEQESQLLASETMFRKDLQKTLLDTTPDENGVPAGLLSRKLGQAKDATVEFDGRFESMRKQYVDGFDNPTQKEAIAKMLDQSYMSARETVIRHEASQGAENKKNILDANLSTRISDAAIITDPATLKDAIKDGQYIQYRHMKDMGLDDGSINVSTGKLATEMAKSAIGAQISSNPKAAMRILDGIKDDLPADSYSDLKAQIDGKLIHDQQRDTWDAVKGFRLADGMMDEAKAMDYVSKLDVPADKKDSISGFVRSMANVEDAQIKQRREAASRNFTNELIDQQSKGMRYEDALPLAAKYGYDKTDIADKQAMITSLYSGKTGAFDTWLSSQGEPTRAAWAYAEDTIKGKYGTDVRSVPGYENNVKVADAAITELKLQAIGKSPDQIRRLVHDSIKDVVIQPGWLWDKTGEGWKKQAAQRQGLSEANTLLEKTYGVNLVGQARAKLIADGTPDTPANLKLLLDTLQAGPKK